MSTTRLKKAKELSAETGIGLRNCVKAYDYANGDHDIAVAYLKAKTLAVATPGLSFDERVQRFLEKREEENKVTHKVKPTKLMKKRVKDINPGDIFLINGDHYIMINPVRKDDESLASILLIASNYIPGLEDIRCVINNSEYVYVKVWEDVKRVERGESGDV